MSYPALLIDTSSRHQIFVRFDAEGRGKFLYRLSEGRSEDIIDQAVDELFGDVTSIAEIWIGEGPGSFVGLRSSFAYVRMLATLAGTRCRTFYSSRLWRALFGLPAGAWFLTRTNARLFYGDRFHEGKREARVVDLQVAESALTGSVYCFAGTWAEAKGKTSALPQADKYCAIEDARLETAVVTEAALALSAPRIPGELTPLYGHELNFTLAKGNNG